ncbi:MAG: RNase A-like domain-containing protein [Nocardioides sp.]
MKARTLIGAGAAVATATIAARIAEYAPRFAAILATLRTLTAGTAALIRATHHALRAQRLRLERFLRVPVRGERGAISLGGSRRWPRGWLKSHEHSGSHTITKHVGKTERELRNQIAVEGKRKASTFNGQDEAERILETVLRKRANDIQRWLAGDQQRRPLNEVFNTTTGTTVFADGTSQVVSRVRVVLERDPVMPDGYRIFTAFPKP